jgi:hypothetical protein
LNSYSPRYAKPRKEDGNHSIRWAIPVALFALGAALGAWIWISVQTDELLEEVFITPTVIPVPTPTPEPIVEPTPVPTPTPTPEPDTYPGWVNPESVGKPWGTTVPGLLTFRGNPTRTFYGTGPIPDNPEIKWQYPENQLLCGVTMLDYQNEEWCGLGWTGQPAIFERGEITWAVFGALDGAIHFVDADTGKQLLKPLQTDDIIKGSVTVDPNGYPIIYAGGRDDLLRVIAIDRSEPVVLWSLDSDTVEGSLWNNDWDGAPLIIDDYLFEGGENSIFHIVKLNRSFDTEGLVVADPELVFTAPGYDDDLIFTVGSNVSIEGSVAISGDTAYFANSGGLVQGWDLSLLSVGEDPVRNFRYWVGDDVDATVVVDEQGFLYVGVEYERGYSRSFQVGQIVKLDPSNTEDPLVWSVFDNEELPDGVWATPALHQDILIVATDSARLMGIDRISGEIRWEFLIQGPLWSSPVVVDDVLLQADCEGYLNAFDVSNTNVSPPLLWRIQVGNGCLEATPAVWDGKIIIGNRDGKVLMLGERSQ